MSKQLKKKVPAGTVVCSRKPQLFWLESGLPGVNYKYTKDARELIAGLVQNRVDYVVLDALGYGSTPMYLYPAIQQFPHLFPKVVMYYENTHMYLLYFDRERAATELEL